MSVAIPRCDHSLSTLPVTVFVCCADDGGNASGRVKWATCVSRGAAEKLPAECPPPCFFLFFPPGQPVSVPRTGRRLPSPLLHSPVCHPPDWPHPQSQSRISDHSARRRGAASPSAPCPAAAAGRCAGSADRRFRRPHRRRPWSHTVHTTRVGAVGREGKRTTVTARLAGLVWLGSGLITQRQREAEDQAEAAAVTPTVVSQ